MRFGLAYLLAGGAVVLLIALYTFWIIGGRAALTVGGLLTALYGFLYIVLQLEDYALLTGSLLLFAVLGIIMFVTRGVDWYAVTFEEKLASDMEEVPAEAMPEAEG